MSDAHGFQMTLPGWFHLQSGISWRNLCARSFAVDVGTGYRYIFGNISFPYKWRESKKKNGVGLPFNSSWHHKDDANLFFRVYGKTGFGCSYSQLPWNSHRFIQKCPLLIFWTLFTSSHQQCAHLFEKLIFTVNFLISNVNSPTSSLFCARDRIQNLVWRKGGEHSTTELHF